MTGKKGALRRSAVGFSTSVLAVLVALVIGVFLPLFMLLVCGFGISMDM